MLKVKLSYTSSANKEGIYDSYGNIMKIIMKKNFPKKKKAQDSRLLCVTLEHPGSMQDQ